MSVPSYLHTVSALLDHLGSSRAQYFGFLRANPEKLYREFEIRGPRGKIRTIQAPHPYLRTLQRNLKTVLEGLYRPPAAAHGFIIEKSIVTNAKMHRRQKQILNLDLADFFPSINRLRVERLLSSNRYGLPVSVARFISHMVTYNNVLPQGAPTSPVISNMIAARLDSKLRILAAESKAIYTRYADDLTFSTSMTELPKTLVEAIEPLRLAPGLVAIIAGEQFDVNNRKTRRASRYVRQRVTGLVVNRFPNVLRVRIDEVRAILHDWKLNGEAEANARFLAKREGRHAHPLSMRMFVEGQIAFISMVRGAGDPVAERLYHELQRRIDPEYVVTREDRLRVAALRFKEVEEERDTKRAGLWLEGAFAALAEADGMLVSRPFRAIDGAIQVDGAIDVRGNDYWVECKWWKKSVGSTALQTLVGKLESALDGTRGIVVSKEGFTDEVAAYLKRIRRGIILIPYVELRQHLLAGGGLEDLILRKWREIATS